MSFSAAPSFDPNVGTPATPAQSAGQATPGVAYFIGNGAPYTGTMQGAYDTDAGPSTIGGIALPQGGSYSGSAPATYIGQADQAGNFADVYSYDPSKYSNSYLAYLDDAGAINGRIAGADTQGLAAYVQQAGLDPQALVDAYGGAGVDNGWLSGPQMYLADASGKYKGPNASALQTYAASPDTQAQLTEAGNRANAVYQGAHPQMSLTGSDYGQIAEGLLGIAAGPLLDMYLPATTAVAGDALDSSLSTTGTAGLGVGADGLGDYASQVGTSLLKKAIPKLVGNAISGQSATKGVINPTMATSFFADGGSVDDTDFFPDDLPDPGSLPDAPSDFFPDDLPTPSSLPSPGAFSGSGLSMGMVAPSAPVNDPENQGTMGNMSGYDPNAAASSNAPQASDAHMPASATGASQSVLGGALQKLGYMNANGDVDLGKALKAGATIAALAVTYLNNKKLQSQGAQIAASQEQPGQVFTLPNTALSNYSGSPFAVGRPTNSNSTVQLHAHGGALMRHHLAMGGPPMQGPLGQPTGAMPPQMMPQGGMNRMPGASPQGPGGMPPPAGGMGGNPNPQMPMGGPPSWQGMAPPPSAVPAPANHFAHGGALGMTQEYQGHGAVRGPGGGQDDIVDARMAPGEYVFDADTVAALGDGSSEEGARRLDAWRKHLREHKRSAPASEIPPKAHAAPHYLRGGAR